MEKDDFKYKVYADLYRIEGKYNKKLLCKYLVSNIVPPGIKYLFVMRLCNCISKKRRNIVIKIFLRLLSTKLRKMQFKYGIEIPYQCDIGEGLFLPHFGGIVLHPNSKIGKNCTILQGVTIGNNLYKSINNVATIGDNVTIAAGVKIIGSISIGNNVTIGANAVVTKDIPDGAVIGGNPAKIISYKEPMLLNLNYLSKKEYFKIE